MTLILQFNKMKNLNNNIYSLKSNISDKTTIRYEISNLDK